LRGGKERVEVPLSRRRKVHLPLGMGDRLFGPEQVVAVGEDACSGCRRREVLRENGDADVVHHELHGSCPASAVLRASAPRECPTNMLAPSLPSLLVIPARDPAPAPRPAMHLPSRVSCPTASTAHRLRLQARSPSRRKPFRWATGSSAASR